MFNTTVDPEELYLRQERIGKGSFGEVFKGINKKSKEVVAIKIIDLEGKNNTNTFFSFLFPQRNYF